MVRPLQKLKAEFNREVVMLRAAIVFFVLALVAILFGATGFAGVSMEIGKTLLYIFLALAVISFLISTLSGGRGTRSVP